MEQLVKYRDVLVSLNKKGYELKKSHPVNNYVVKSYDVWEKLDEPSILIEVFRDFKAIIYHQDMRSDLTKESLLDLGYDTLACYEVVGAQSKSFECLVNKDNHQVLIQKTNTKTTIYNEQIPDEKVKKQGRNRVEKD
jgi:hypothetical protein